MRLIAHRPRSAASMRSRLFPGSRAERVRCALGCGGVLICLLAAAPVFAQKKPTGPGPKTPDEQKAVAAMLQAQTPDDKIKAVDDLITRFANTDYKSFALEQEAE